MPGAPALRPIQLGHRNGKGMISVIVSVQEIAIQILYHSHGLRRPSSQCGGSGVAIGFGGTGRWFPLFVGFAKRDPVSCCKHS